MSNPDRKLVTVKHIDRIEQHPNADRLELAYVGGWQCVVAKGEFSVGQLVLYFEPDSFIDVSDPRFEFLKERGVKTMRIGSKDVDGHVLRTIKLRGEFSQGLVLDAAETLGASKETIAELCAAKVNLAKSLGVVEYEPIRGTDQGNMHILRRYDAQVAPRTDAVRVQNVSEEVFNALKDSRYFVSVKVDGTSMTCLFDPRYNRIRLFSHNNELGYDFGFGEQVYKQAVEQGIIEWATTNPGKTVQFEACGPKINGNRLGLKALKLFVFSVWDTDKCEYLHPDALFNDYDGTAIGKSKAPIVYLDLHKFPTTLDLIEWVDGLRGKVTDRLDEGIVIHCIGRGETSDEHWRLLQNELGPQMQVKVISRKYLLKSKD